MKAAAANESANATPSAEEVALKKNTDCVYFLASPLTCKKGNECEFRHSENARVNPRDCWWWLSGSCLNRDCSYRHPPLDVRPAPAPAPTPAPPPPVNSKGRTPCYFYNHGYCARGDRCSFMHGSPGLPTPPQATAAPQAVQPATQVQPPAAPKPMETTAVEVEMPRSEIAVAKPTGLLEVQLQTAAAVTRSSELAPAPKVSITPRNGTFEPEPEVQRSSELVEGIADDEESPVDTRAENGGVRELEDRWEESSPGFDVLVDDGPDDEMHYGDGEADYADPGLDEGMEPYAYDYSEYPRTGGFEQRGPYERRSFDPYDRPDFDRGSYERGSNYNHRDYQQHTGYEAFDHIDYDRPRFDHTVEPDIYRRLRVDTPNARPEISIRDRLNFNSVDRRAYLDNGDLRNHLEKRRRLESMDRYRRERVPREFEEPGYRYNDGYERLHQDHQQRRQQANYLQHARLNGRRSRDRTSVDRPGGRRFQYPVEHGDFVSQQRPRNAQHAERRNSREGLAPAARQGVYRKMEARSNGASDFAPPKSLAQIRAEKRKFQGDEEEGGGGLSKCSSVEGQTFSAPKPLSEILKEKRKFGGEFNNVRRLSNGAGDEGIEPIHNEPHPVASGVADELSDEDDFAKTLGGY